MANYRKKVVPKRCLFCKKLFSKNPEESYKQWNKRQFCTKSCARSGKFSVNWKGGVSCVKPKCVDCGKEVSDYRAKRCKNCRSKFYSTGSRNGNWKGGVSYDGLGYKMIYKPNHPYAKNKKYVYKHRIVMEEKLGRYLKTNEIVHHRNVNITDNRLDNLELLTKSEHMKKHFLDRKRNRKGQFI